MQEQVGSGVAVLDFDGDGRMDVYLVQCGGKSSGAKNQLYHQEADGTFRNVSEASGADLEGEGMGAFAGDVNNDGRPDLLVTEFGAARLLLCVGAGRFREVTPSSGIDNTRWATAASFLDYDRDGWLDIVVVNYLDYSPAQPCKDAAGKPEYCGPDNFAGTVTRLFHNRGKAGMGGRMFEDVTVASGLAAAPGPGLGVVCMDFDGDRWPDIFVADDGRANRLFMNRHDGTFREEASIRGIAFNAMGGTAGNMGVAPGDVDGDGMADLFVTHLVKEQHALWVQGPRGLFQDRTAALGLHQSSWRGTGFGALLADLDLDGHPDLMWVNGAVRRSHRAEPKHPRLSPEWHAYAQRYQVFAHREGRFQDISESNPDFSGMGLVGRGLALADFDNDGAPDLLSTSTAGPAQLFRNIAPRNGHWLKLRLLDTGAGGRDAIGAEVLIETGAQRHWRCLQPSSSYLTSNDPHLFFGLGKSARADRIRVSWPDGSESVYEDVPADQTLVLRKAAPAARALP